MGVLLFTKELSRLAFRYQMMFEIICICAVDVYLIISGYYLCKNEKRSIWKVIDLLLLTVIFTELKYVLICLINKESLVIGTILKKLVPSNYFIIRYSTLYLMSPLINKAFDTRDNKELNKLVFGSFLLISIIPTLIKMTDELCGIKFTGLSPISDYDSNGYTIVNFVLLYIIGLYIRRQNKQFGISKLLCMLLLNIVIMCGYQAIYMHKYDSMWSSILSYDNPLVIAEACLFFKVFEELRISCNSHKKIIDELAKSSLVCYLFHGTMVLTIPYRAMFENTTMYISCMLVLVCCLGIYVECYFVYKFFTIVTVPLMRYVRQRISTNKEMTR